jgi:hypothetical protein
VSQQENKKTKKQENRNFKTSASAFGVKNQFAAIDEKIRNH